MRKIDFVSSQDRDEWAVYIDGEFEETIDYLSPDDFHIYGDEDDHNLVRSIKASEPLEVYLRVHEEWPLKLRTILDVINNS